MNRLKTKQKRTKLNDTSTQEFIARQFMSLIRNTRKQKICDAYVDYLLFSIIGHHILEHSPTAFNGYIKEIRKKVRGK